MGDQKKYSKVVERQMVRFYCSLNERDRRRYAAIEAAKLGHGGIQYISGLLRCDRKTIARGMNELNEEQELAICLKRICRSCQMKQDCSHGQ